MDVNSLYTNIDHEEGAQACYEKLEQRKNKNFPSIVIKELILIVLRSNVFRFCYSFYHQIKGTAMGTPMAPNYSNIFMDKFERELLSAFERKTGLRPLIWFRFIDDIFFIWTHDKKSLDYFIKFAQEFSEKRKMRSKIKFEVNISQTTVNFLDVKVLLDNDSLKTTLFTKPTDAHLYLNSSSCHPNHVIKNIPKGQFIRLRRICSEKSDFTHHSQTLIQHFTSRGYNKKQLLKTLTEVSNTDRAEYLTEKKRLPIDPSSIFVSTWHPSLKNLPKLLKDNFSILETNTETQNIFKSKPTVAFRKMKTLRNHVVRSDTIRTQTIKSTKPCGKCKICSWIDTNNTISNEHCNITININTEGTCKSKQIIYAGKCTEHKLLYIGHTGEQLSSRFSKHRYDINNRPENNELSKHLSTNHDINNSLKVQILQDNLPNKAMRKFYEDLWICRLQTLQPTGLNTEIGAYAKEMYSCYTKALTTHKHSL